jgi:hypothetical protein
MSVPPSVTRFEHLGRRRSYDLKFDRAEKHLIDLETEVSRYCATHPYAITQSREGRRQQPVWRFTYTSQPPDVIALITADFIYNVRSGLDHLSATLVPANDRQMFPSSSMVSGKRALMGRMRSGRNYGSDGPLSPERWILTQSRFSS